MKFESLITIDTIISIFALVLAIGSAIYTWKSNRYSMSLSNVSSETNRGQLLFEFTLTNTSSRPLRLKKLILKRDNSVIIDNNFDVVAHDKAIDLRLAKEYEREHLDPLTGTFIGINPHLVGRQYSEADFSHNFTREVFFLPSQSVTFSYFLDTLPSSLETLTDKNIRLFSKIKLFPVQFD